FAIWLQREKAAGSRCVISMHSSTTTIRDPRNPEHVKTFTFDLAYWSHSGFQKDKDGFLMSTGSNSAYADQRDIFRDLGQGVLDNAWQGYNATILAYGQTGSGKSYSMIGCGANRGIIPNVCEELFKAIQTQEENQYQVTFSMLEIYNEQVIDLLSKTKKPGGLKVFLEGDLTKQSSINLVDLAGSERQKSSGSDGDRLREGTRVNLSLTTLGNVISALAAVAVGKRMLHIPYRDSILTKLLQPALGGNSRTVMIAAISPADICYEETLSTLRYAESGNYRLPAECIALGLSAHPSKSSAETVSKSVLSVPRIYHLFCISSIFAWERTKKIKNKAVVNTSPTEKLIKELKAENNQLLFKLAGLGNSGKRVADKTKELASLLAENQLRIQAIQMTWEYQLEEARKEWKEQCAAISQEQRMVKSFPYLLNVNEDPQLTGVLKHFIQDGSCDVGQAASNAISLRGLGISDKHATFTNVAGKVTVVPRGKGRVVVNGVLIVLETKLQHLDRIILGSTSAYLYIGFPSERGSEDLTPFDYDFFQSELAAAEGVSMDQLAATNDGKPDPSVLAVFQDYIKLMPLVAEANQMSEELMKELRLELKVKNLASSDSRGNDLQKEVVVKVTNEKTNEVWMWSKAKFINRKFLMEEVYQRFLDGEDLQITQENDPFWDPVEAIHLGSAHVWLQSLAYCMKLEEQTELLNSDGLEEATILVDVIPCSRSGEYVYLFPLSFSDKNSKLLKVQSLKANVCIAIDKEVKKQNGINSYHSEKTEEKLFLAPKGDELSLPGASSQPHQGRGKEESLPGLALCAPHELLGQLPHFTSMSEAAATSEEEPSEMVQPPVEFTSLLTAISGRISVPQLRRPEAKEENVKQPLDIPGPWSPELAKLSSFLWNLLAISHLGIFRTPYSFASQLRESQASGQNGKRRCGFALKPSLVLFRNRNCPLHLRASREMETSAWGGRGGPGGEKPACTQGKDWNQSEKNSNGSALHRKKNGKTKKMKMRIKLRKAARAGSLSPNPLREHKEEFSLLSSHTTCGGQMASLGLCDSDTDHGPPTDLLWISSPACRSDGHPRTRLIRRSSAPQPRQLQLLPQDVLWGLQLSLNFAKTGTAHFTCVLREKWRRQPGVGEEGQVERSQPAPKTPAPELSELHLKLLKLEQKSELLRNIVRTLWEENMLFKDWLKSSGIGQQKESNLAKPPDKLKLCTHRASCDAEFAKALNIFYQSMNQVKGQFLKLRHFRAPEDDKQLRFFTEKLAHMLKDFEQLLDSSLWKLKNNVALVIQKKRENSVPSKCSGSTFPRSLKVVKQIILHSSKIFKPPHFLFVYLSY
ncbi:kinesin-like protein KIF28P, partial [Ornithorhynchus anatinus]|uniref:kinesin-like protein KIF28P n=1 Tax=Ornithorhynchus anatinus TaxID=9258 RepID=UPI0019D4A8CD